MTKKIKEHQINDTLDLVRHGFDSKDETIVNAAESVLSWCVLNLRHHQAEMPKEMMPYYKRLHENKVKSK